MNKGKIIGGQMATPIRDMLESQDFNGIVFHCENENRAESARNTALIFRRRNQYDYKTKRRGANLIVYKGDEDPDYENHIRVELKGDLRKHAY